MKDIAHHLRYIQRKIIRNNRQEELKATRLGLKPSLTLTENAKNSAKEQINSKTQP
ncbi:hypothetical protein [Candidatus Protochlamydia sp. W-9]|uniref:hypothetical protein n=1 Tax=Candidatus Protochlamydia sp. W-9 TaxID=1785087 RepID=UPI000A7560DD|nr:hypothetical protein [Candidatus Protochlamydia sp. W-9]